MVNALLWEIGRSHVSSISYLISHSKLSARLFPPSSVARLSFFHGPQGSDIITVYFNLHHRHLRNDKSRWTSIKSFFYSIFFLLFSVTSRVSFLIISYMYICIIVHHLLSLSLTSSTLAERNLPYVMYFRSSLLGTQEAGRLNNARLYLLRDREIDQRFVGRNNH